MSHPARGSAPPAEPAQAAAAVEARPSWWRLSYLADYASIVVSAGLVGGLRTMEPNSSAIIGPTYSADDWEAILDPGLSDMLGRPHREDSVPELGLAVMAGTGLAGIIVMEWIPGLNGRDDVDWQLAHDSLLGYIEAMSWSLALTEIAKVGIGRLRPDFQDRARRYHCGTLGQTDGACDGFAGQPLSEDEYDRARKSFVSGHASLSFAIATYWSLVIGGRLVWGKRASDGTVALGVLMQGALMTSAAFVAASRVEDGRHHGSDVAVGAGIGLGFAAVAYFRHFGFDGLPRTRADRPAGVKIDLGPAARGLGLGLAGSF